MTHYHACALPKGLRRNGLKDAKTEKLNSAFQPARAPVAETLTLERTLSDLVNQAYALTPAEIGRMW